MGYIFICALLVFLIAGVSGQHLANSSITVYDTPFGNSTVAAEPRGRGTFGIIFSCTATFAFCIWTAVHPNIIGNTTTWYRFLYKAVITIVSIIVPEGVMICAWGQWRDARGIQKAWRKKFPKAPKDSFGMDVAFFVVMGGFVVDEAWKPISAATSHAEPKSHQSEVELDPIPYTATLTTRGFLRYLNDEYIHEGTFDPKAISDKGKASNIAKLLASTQALWLLAQCASRWKSGLDITLLEIHVVIQVLCTIFIYLCWWNKPLDVAEPVKISLRKKDSDPLNFETPVNFRIPGTLDTEEANSKEYSKSHYVITKQAPQGVFAVAARALFDIVLYIDSREDNQERLEHAADRQRNENYIQNQSRDLEDAIKTSAIETSTTAAAVIDEKKPRSVGIPAFLAEAILVAIIGSLHAAAWRIHFPTPLESWLWRASSIGMIFFPCTAVMISIIAGYDKDLIAVLWRAQYMEVWLLSFILKNLKAVHEVCKRHGKGSTARVALHYFLVWTFLLFLGAYGICIVFITVESYISLRDPPTEAFLTPVWSDYWPHL